ncbi:MAG TPA: helix-turn-helix domain-containing protein [Chthoniobacterales bacterium]|jgi:AraC-like DNA-binding protein/ligand-binding sensor protein
MNTVLVATLVDSAIYRDYARAWRVATGMPLQFIAAEAWNYAAGPASKRTPLCALIESHSSTCAVWLQARARLLREAAAGPCTRICSFGLCETAVPVRLGETTIGFLLTGQVLREAPSEKSFQEFRRRVGQTAASISPERLREAYFQTPVAGAKVQRAALHLLVIFAEHLASLANQIVLDSTHAEPHVLQRVKTYINDHLDEEVSLDELARHIGSSKFYICKLFRRSMGITFTEYRARRRVERAKALLLEQNRRVSEVAYDAGFQSLTHFNRIFRRFVGTSPSDFREHLAHA